MCQILFQVYGCGHTQPICTTPCLHALATSSLNPFLDAPTLDLSPPATPKTPVSPVHMARTTPARPQLSLRTAHAGSIPALVSPQQPHGENDVEIGMSMEEPPPNFCAPPREPYRYLRPSRYPCLACYMQPRWAGYRQRWVQEYRVMHSETKTDDLERLVGVEQIPGRAGLPNVMWEVDSMVVRKGDEGMK